MHEAHDALDRLFPLRNNSLDYDRESDERGREKRASWIKPGGIPPAGAPLSRGKVRGAWGTRRPRNPQGKKDRPRSHALKTRPIRVRKRSFQNNPQPLFPNTKGCE